MTNPTRRVVRRSVAYGLPLLAVAALVGSIWSSFARNAATRRDLERMCAYQASGTVQGNTRARFIIHLAEAHEALLATAADARERSALLEQASDPRQARIDLEAASAYRQQRRLMRQQLAHVRTRKPIDCPN